MAADPTRPIDLSVFRDRVLTEVSQALPEGANFATPQETKETFDRLAFVANKANVLARAIAAEAAKWFIPVHPDDVEARAAVQRKSTDSPDGSQISFDLFRDAVDAMYRRKLLMGEMVLRGGFRDPGTVFSKKIRRLRLRTAYSPEELSDAGIEILIAQFFIIWVAHELMKPWEGMIHEEFVSLIMTDTENAQEKIALDIVIGIAIQLLIFGLNDALAADFLESSSFVRLPRGMRGKDVVAAARKIGLSEGMSLAQAYIGQNDHEVILRYSMEFISKSEDPGYDMWIAYLDAVDIRFTAQSLWAMAPEYSVAHAVDIAAGSGRRRRRRGGSRGESKEPAVDDLGLEARIKDAALSGITPIVLDHRRALDEASSRMSRSLDLIAQVVSSEYAREIVCCLARVLAKMPKKALTFLRAMLQGLRAANLDLTAVDLGTMLSRLLDMNFIELMAAEAMLQAERFFDKVLRKLFGLFSEDMKALLCCPLLRELMEQVLSLLAKIKGEFLKALRKFVDLFDEKEMERKRRYHAMNDRRYVSKLIQIVSEVIRLLEQIEICNVVDPKVVEDRVFEQVNLMARLPTIRIESADKGKYFSTATSKVDAKGRRIPPVGEEVGFETDDDEGEAPDPLHLCRKVFGEGLIKAAADGFKSS